MSLTQGCTAAILMGRVVCGCRAELFLQGHRSQAERQGRESRRWPSFNAPPPHHTTPHRTLTPWPQVLAVATHNHYKRILQRRKAAREAEALKHAEVSEA